MEEFGHMEV